MKITLTQLRKIIAEEVSSQSDELLLSDIEDAIESLTLEARKRRVDESFLGGLVVGVLALPTLRALKKGIKKAAAKIEDEIWAAAYNQEKRELVDIENELLDRVQADEEAMSLLKQYDETKDPETSKRASQRIAQVTKDFARELKSHSVAFSSPQKTRSQLRDRQAGRLRGVAALDLKNNTK